ncbi:MAG: lysophospholipid acyltransferase family protein [Deltaproteobacteria bacterium]|nr:lysophospholipid acyltransferase family protein [Deltaproteobacteria bacterium]
MVYFLTESARDKLYLGLFSFFKTLLRFLPPRLLISVTKQIGILIKIFCPREVKLATRQLELALEVPKEERSKIVRNLFRHVGESIGELLLIDRLEVTPYMEGAKKRKFPWQISISSPSTAYVQKVINSPKGAIGLSAHIGCFELLAAYYCAIGMNLTVVGRTPNYSFLEYILRNLRLAYGTKTIWRNELNSGQKILRALKKGGTVAFLIDQDTSLDNAFSPFFGLRAASPFGPIVIGLKYGLPIFSSFIIRTDALTHEVHTKQIDYSNIFDSSSDKHSREEIMLAAQYVLDIYNKRLEKVIREHPEQWIWWHRRWRRRPGIDYKKEPHKLPSYQGYLSWLSEILEKRNAGELLENY